MKKYILSILLFVTIFSANAEESAIILNETENKKELRMTETIPPIVVDNQKISVYPKTQSSTISVSIYDTEGYMVYRKISSGSSCFSIPSLYAHEDYIVVITIDSASYMIDMIQ